MIKKLYECGCFNYQKFIIDNMKSLALSSDEAILLIQILKQYPENKTLSSEVFLSTTSLTKSKVEKALASLLERCFYEIYITYENGVGQEYISMDGFFNKVSRILDGKENNKQDELHTIHQFLAQEFNRILTAKEIEIITSLVVEDCYTLSDFKQACESIKKKEKMLTIRLLAQALAGKEEKSVQPTSKLVQDFIKSIK